MGNQLARVAHRTVQNSVLPHDQRNDRWLTPYSIIDALGPFDLDPAGAPDHFTATEIWLPEDGIDGLAENWSKDQRVWLNPPYGRIMRSWVEKLVEHNNGTLLIPVATGTKLWMDVVFPNATAIHFWRHRIKFLRRDGLDDDMVSPAASAIISFGHEDAVSLLAADLPGVTLDLR